MLIQAALGGSPPVAGVTGGFADQLPKDQVSAAAPMAWTYKTIVLEPDYVIGGQTGWTDWHVQIDCHGFTAANAITLLRSIDSVLRGGFRGVLPDPDSTYVFQTIRQGPAVSGFSDADRTYVRSLEYLVSYQQQ
jgi:hypothetical protein